MIYHGHLTHPDIWTMLRLMGEHAAKGIVSHPRKGLTEHRALV